jgi:hypothetical protein
MRYPIFLLLASAVFAQDANEIIRRASDRDFTNFETRKNYTYQERTELRQYDGKGKLSKTEVETNEILILEGQPYEKLIARNDKPLSEKDAAKEQKKLDNEVQKRKNQSAKENARLEKERLEEKKYLREFTEAFNFKIVGEDTVSGKPTWVISVIPKPGYRPKESNAKVFTKLRGKVWIDQGEYHWVKAEGEAIDTLSFGLFLFRVAPGATLSFEQTSVNGEVWLPSRISVRAEARIAILKKMHAEIDITYRDYKKFQADSKIVAETHIPKSCQALFLSYARIFVADQREAPRAPLLPLGKVFAFSPPPDTPCFHSHSFMERHAPVPVGVLIFETGAAISVPNSGVGSIQPYAASGWLRSVPPSPTAGAAGSPACAPPPPPLVFSDSCRRGGRASDSVW